MSVLRDDTGRVRGGWVVVVFALVAAIVGGGSALVFTLLGWMESDDLGSPLVIFATLPSVLGGLAGTWAVTRWFQEASGLQSPSPARQLALGWAFGALALIVACVVPVAVGVTSLRWNTPLPVASVLLQLLTLGPAGLGEELLLRGAGFQALRRSLGDRWAVLVSSLVFGAMHLMNPHASWVAALLIALVGLWFGSMMVRSGSVWLPMGVHVAWNFFEGAVFGQPVSGNAAGPSLLVGASTSPSSFWNGGAFGPEAAGWTAVVLSVAVVLTGAIPKSNRVDERSLGG